MNESTLESFINYCDEMKIAEEGLKDIGKKFVEVIKKLIEKVQLILAKMTKNKPVDINEDFYKLYDNAKYQLDYAWDLVSECDKATYDIDHALNKFESYMKDLRSSSATPVNTNSSKTLNTYEIFKEMTKCKDKLKVELKYWGMIEENADSFEELQHKYTLKLLNKEITLYSAVYSKIKSFK